jgi:hypothetical protein
MFRKKTLELNLRVTQVRARLEGQLNKRRPIGKVEEGRFSLYKCLGSMDQGGFFYFNITGDYSKTENGARIAYRVLPDTATCLILLVISIALLTILAGLLGGKFNSDLALTVIAVNVIMCGYSLWGMKNLGERFKELFTVENP